MTKNQLIAQLSWNKILTEKALVENAGVTRLLQLRTHKLTIQEDLIKLLLTENNQLKKVG